LAAVYALIEAGADVTLRQGSGETPLLTASERSRRTQVDYHRRVGIRRADTWATSEIFLSLLELPLADPVVVDDKGRTILHWILEQGNIELFEVAQRRLKAATLCQLLIIEDKAEYTPLFRAWFASELRSGETSFDEYRDDGEDSSEGPAYESTIIAAL
jgi:ankyrin repeat protein